MSDVVRLVTPEEAARDSALDAAVSLLEDVIATAKERGAVGVLAVVELADGDSVVAFTEAWDGIRRVGALELLKSDWLRALARDDDE